MAYYHTVSLGQPPSTPALHPPHSRLHPVNCDMDDLTRNLAWAHDSLSRAVEFMVLLGASTSWEPETLLTSVPPTIPSNKHLLLIRLMLLLPVFCAHDLRNDRLPRIPRCRDRQAPGRRRARRGPGGAQARRRSESGTGEPAAAPAPSRHEVLCVWARHNCTR
jgi:hypothetical protein